MGQSNSNSRSHNSAIQALNLVIEASRAGRQIIPLHGAGISADSGIPSTTQIHEYLAKVRYLMDSTEGLDLRSGWIDINEINEWVIRAARRRPREEKAQLAKDILFNAVMDGLSSVYGPLPHDVSSREESNASRAEKLRHRELYFRLTSWRTTLRRICDGDPALIDQFHEHLTRDRRPAKTHRFAAFLAQMLGCRIILTTNFDDLLRDAFIETGQRPNVFEINEQAQLPPEELVREGQSLMKLHGGRTNLRLVDSLDSAFDLPSQNRFLSFLPTDSLMLVTGYKGADRRVMSLIEAFLAQSHGASLVWVYRREVPSSVESLMRRFNKSTETDQVISLEYADLGMFLQELCLRVRSAFPVSQQPYETLTTSSPATHRQESLKGTRGMSTREQLTTEESVVVVYGLKGGLGTSTWLSNLAKRHASSHRVVWLDLEEIQSANALVGVLLAKLQSHDKGLLPIVLSPEAWNHDDNKPDPRIRQLVRAMRRSKYFVGIDSIGEFGRGPLGHGADGSVSDRTAKYSEMCNFLLDMAKQANELGESKFCFVLTRIDVPNEELELSDTINVGPNNAPGAATTRSENADDDEQSARNYEIRFEVTPTADGVAPGEVPKDMREEDASTAPMMIGRYRVERLIGRGGFGDVYLVKDESLDQYFAAKVLRKHRSQNDGNPHDEARKAIKVDHKHVVRVFSAEHLDDGRPYIIYEYVQGTSLRDRLNSDPASLGRRERVRLVAQVAKALDYAHREGLVHFDIKPENILIDRHGNAKIADFGLAQWLSEINSRGGGTLSYMSPEQFSLDRPLPGAPTDIYSLGVNLYELLAGRRPFNEEGLSASDENTRRNAHRALIRQITEAKFPSLFEMDVDPPISRLLAHVCHKCLDRNIEMRFRSAGEVAEALQSWLNSYASLSLATKASCETAEGVFQHSTTRLMKMESETALQVAMITPNEPIGYFKQGHSEAVIKKITEEGTDVGSVQNQIETLGNTVPAAIDVLWDKLSERHQTIFVLATAFRRPRSIVALRRIGARLMNDRGYVLSALASFSDKVGGEERTTPLPAYSDDRFCELVEAVDDALADLEDADLLIRQDGGFYWLHSVVRDAVYRRCVELEPQGMSNLHEMIADYYYEQVFLPSNDINAFFEFVFHQTYAIRESDPEQRLRRLQTLDSSLRREKEALLGYTDSSALLEWVHAFSTGARLESGGDRDDEELRKVSQSIRAFLCDIEGEIHRRNTNYDKCAEMRLRQVRHAVKPLVATRNLGVQAAEFSFEEWSGATADRLSKALSTLVESAAKILEEDSGPNRAILLRLLGHSMDLAVCMQGSHFHKAARPLLQQINGSMANLLRTKWNDGALDVYLRLKCSSSMRFMESLSMEVGLWDDPSKRSDHLEQIQDEYTLARQVLARYTGSARREFARHSCGLLCLVARTHYLQHEFDRAYLMLDEAQASVHSEADDLGRLTLAVCELRWAECLMLHANVLATQGEAEVNIARAKLDSARTSVAHAREILLRHHGSVWRWTLLYLLQSQLLHEETLLSFQSNEKETSERERWGMVRDGLAAVCAGLDNIAKDHVRQAQFEVLWGQFHLLFLRDSMRDPTHCLKEAVIKQRNDEWDELNRQLGLDWLLVRRRQEVERRTRILGQKLAARLVDDALDEVFKVIEGNASVEAARQKLLGVLALVRDVLENATTDEDDALRRHVVEAWKVLFVLWAHFTPEDPVTAWKKLNKEWRMTELFEQERESLSPSASDELPVVIAGRKRVKCERIWLLDIEAEILGAKQ